MCFTDKLVILNVAWDHLHKFLRIKAFRPYLHVEELLQTTTIVVIKIIILVALLVSPTVNILIVWINFFLNLKLVIRYLMTRIWNIHLSMGHILLLKAQLFSCTFCILFTKYLEYTTYHANIIIRISLMFYKHLHRVVSVVGGLRNFQVN